MNEEQIARINQALAANIIGAEAITELIELIGLLSNWGVSEVDVVRAIEAQEALAWDSALKYAEQEGLPVFNYRFGRMDIDLE